MARAGDDLRALGRELLDDREADPLAGPRHHGDLVRQLEVH
jgi:hypothetical protein